MTDACPDCLLHFVLTVPTEQLTFLYSYIYFSSLNVYVVIASTYLHLQILIYPRYYDPLLYGLKVGHMQFLSNTSYEQLHKPLVIRGKNIKINRTL